MDWLHGHIPWWNPYEGVGSPLAGEMQSGAFFLPTFLLLFHQGMLYLQIFLETATGWATYLLARRMGVGRTFSIAGGVAFGLCGSYAWLTHAPVRPILLLPLSLLGVERALTAARERRPGGWRLLAVALAFSILAGFPETTLIDGIFVAWWALLRMSGPGRDCWRSMVAKLAAGVAAGVALAAPLLVAFLTFLPHANIGGHGPVEAHSSLPSAGISQLLLPYSLGPINAFRGGGLLAGNVDAITALWGSVGGYLTVTLVAAALVGLVGRRNRRLRVGLGAWVLLCLLRTFGFGPAVFLMAGIPGINATAFYRYADASWELAIVVLAVLGLDDVARLLTPRRVLVRSGLLTAGLAAWAGAAVWGVMGGAATFTAGHHGRGDPYIVASWLLAGVVLAALLIGGWRSARNFAADLSRRTRQIKRRGRILAAAAICAESVLLLGFTYGSAPPPTTLQLGSVAWLQSHLGTYRFATMGPIQPNYGSFFQIAQANTTDLPIASDWVVYVNSMLDTNSPTLIFTGAATIDPQAESPADRIHATPGQLRIHRGALHRHQRQRPGRRGVPLSHPRHSAVARRPPGRLPRPLRRDLAAADPGHPLHPPAGLTEQLGGHRLRGSRLLGHRPRLGPGDGDLLSPVGAPETGREHPRLVGDGRREGGGGAEGCLRAPGALPGNPRAGRHLHGAVQLPAPA